MIEIKNRCVPEPPFFLLLAIGMSMSRSSSMGALIPNHKLPQPLPLQLA